MEYICYNTPIIETSIKIVVIHEKNYFKYCSNEYLPLNDINIAAICETLAFFYVHDKAHY